MKAVEAREMTSRSTCRRTSRNDSRRSGAISPGPRREAIAIEGYRSGALSQDQVQRLLGLASRWEVDALLKRAGVYLDYTEEDVAREVEDSREQ